MPKSSSTSNSSQVALFYFLFKLGLFLAPLCLIAALMLSRPLDAATLRIWEAVSVLRPNVFLPGPFYPRVTMEKIEGSELTLYQKNAPKKKVVWHTDAYGYRKHPHGGSQYDVVLVGDSNIAGSGLTQNNMLSEMLEEETGLRTYPLAPTSLNSFFTDSRFFHQKPKLVIVSNIERDLESLHPVRVAAFSEEKSNFYVEMKWVQRIAILIDRFFYKKAEVRKILSKRSFFLSEKKGAREDVLFLQGAVANRERSSEVIEKVASAVVSYRDALRKYDIDFIFLPIPNKESIYADQVPGARKATFIPSLIEALKKKGVVVVDLQTAYQRARLKQPDVLLYDPGDTHWNREGVNVAARELVPFLKERRAV